MLLGPKVEWLTRLMCKASVCREAGINQNTLWRIIKRGHTPSAETARRIANTLNVDLAWLLDPNSKLPPVRTKEPEDGDHAPRTIAA